MYLKKEFVAYEDYNNSPLKRKISIGLSILSFVLIYFFGVYIIHLLHVGIDVLEDTSNVSVVHFFTFYKDSVQLYLILAFLDAGIIFFVKTQLEKRFKSTAHGQKGDSRFTTIDELYKQYTKIPLKDKRYKGESGVHISTHKEYLFIDTSTSNNCVIGTSRSGKGETHVVTTIDVGSRAEFQPSFIISDPKGELCAASFETLTERGYECQVLNLLEPDFGLSYNILELIKSEYSKGNYSAASSLCNTLTYSLFNDPNAKDPFWNNAAASLVNALILAITEQCFKGGFPEKITIGNVYTTLTALGGKNYVDELGMSRNELDDFFNSLPDNNLAKKQYATVNFSGDNARGSIMSVAASKLSIFSFEPLERMTSLNSFELKRVGFPKWLTIKLQLVNEKVRVLFVDNKNKIIFDEQVGVNSFGIAELNFKSVLKNGYKIVVETVHSKKKERAVFSFSRKAKSKIVDGKRIPIRNNITGKIEFSKHAILTPFNHVDFIEKIDMVYTTKPLAVFMIIPDYDASNNVIASIFIKQLYTELAKNASKTKGNKCHRRVRFLLDEFGNIPAIEGMKQVLTVCLGRNILFDLIIQSYSQLTSVYGENDAKIIKENCQNHIYIMSTDLSTAEELSKKAGYRTVENVNYSGNDRNLHESRTRSADKEALIEPNRLLQMSEGETLVLRFLKRQDNNRNRVRPYPIFNTGKIKTSMKFRYEYLADKFDTSKSLYDIEIPSLHKNLSLKDVFLTIDEFIHPEKQNFEAYETEDSKSDTVETEDDSFFLKGRQNAQYILQVLKEKYHLSDKQLSEIYNLRNSEAEEYFSNYGLTEFYKSLSERR